MKSLFITSAVFSTLFFMPAAMADTVKYQATLNAANDVPPVSSSATGTAMVTYDTMTKLISWQVQYQGLTGDVVAAHFHGPATTTQNAPPVITMQGNVKQGSATLTDAQAADLAAGKWYINLHTKKFPDGEIRGQLVKAQ